MRYWLIVWLVVLSALCVPHGAAAQAPVERKCADDAYNNRCDPQALAKMYALYDIASPQSLLDAGTTMRRAMIVDGYGRDVVAITFSRAPGQSPQVEVRSPLGDGPPPQPLVAKIDLSTWDEVIETTRLFDRELAPLSSANEIKSALQRICLHPWVSAMERVDASRVDQLIVYGAGSDARRRDPALPVEVSMTEPELASVSHSSCGDSLVPKIAFQLVRIAREALPECAGLDSDNYRTEANVLALCHQLRGDRSVASEIADVPHRFRRAIRTQNKQELNWLFVGVGDDRSTRFTTELGDGDVFWNAPEGIDRDHARLTGLVVWDDAEGNPVQQGDLTLNFLRVAGDFAIDTFNFGPRRPYVWEDLGAE